jgi:hypothetical protein
VLRLGAYQLLFLDRVAPASAVSSSVELARDVGIARAAGFANAVLRSLAGQVAEHALRWPDREEDPEGWLVSMGSLPQWIAARWLAVRRGAERLRLRNVRTLERDATKSFDLRGRQSFPRTCRAWPSTSSRCSTPPAATSSRAGRSSIVSAPSPPRRRPE